MRVAEEPLRRDSGSVVAENAMTMGLVVAVFLVVCQFAYAVHVRSTLTMAAVEGARVGARVEAVPGTASVRTRDVITQSLSSRYAEGVTERSEVVEGVDVIRVDVTAPVPVLGPLGIGLNLHTSGRAVREERG